MPLLSASVVVFSEILSEFDQFQKPFIHLILVSISFSFAVSVVSLIAIILVILFKWVFDNSVAKDNNVHTHKLVPTQKYEFLYVSSSSNPDPSYFSLLPSKPKFYRPLYRLEASTLVCSLDLCLCV